MALLKGIFKYGAAVKNDGLMAGRTSVLSGQTTIVVSTAACNSNSIISYGIQTSVTSHRFIDVVVGTINPGVNLVFALDKATVTSDYTIMWRMLKTSL